MSKSKAKPRSIRILRIEPKLSPIVKEMKCDFDSLVKEVGGFIEIVHPFKDTNVVCIIDDEGRLKQLPFNIYLGGHAMFGPIVIARESSDPDDDFGFVGLTAEDVVKYREYFIDDSKRKLRPEDKRLPRPKVMTFDNDDQLFKALELVNKANEAARED